MTGKPTQVAHPLKASVRTAVQTFVPLIIALMLAGPDIVEAFADVPTEGAAWASLAGIAVGLAAVAGALARVAAIPAVNAFLIRLGLGTGVEKEDTPAHPGTEQGM